MPRDRSKTRDADQPDVRRVGPGREQTPATTTPAHDPTHDPTIKAEILISRIIDGEATDSDRARFEELSRENPSLRDLLAQRQRDTDRLTSELTGKVQAILSRDPSPALTASMPVAADDVRRARRAWFVAAGGWSAAAGLLIALIGVLTMQPAVTDHHVSQPVGDDPESTRPALEPDEMLREYLNAPFVLGQLDPVLLESEVLPDGRLALRFMRRIEEVIFLDPEMNIDLDEQWHLLDDPSELRTRQNAAERAPRN